MSATMIPRTGLHVHCAFAVPGQGQTVRANRVLPWPAHEQLDPFIMLSEDWVEQGYGFDAHPHRGFETVTLILEGALEHRDSQGHAGVLGPGDVQWMTAGSGIVHSEMPNGREQCHFLQLWLNLPIAEKMCAPRYQDLLVSDIPVVDAGGARVRVISGKYQFAAASTQTVVDTTVLDVELQFGSTVKLEVPAGHSGFIYSLFGAASVHSAKVEIVAGDVLLMPPMTGSTSLDLTQMVLKAVTPQNQTRSRSRPWNAGSYDLDAGTARMIVVHATPLREPVATRGPFVMSTDEECTQAFRDYSAGAFGVF